MMTSRRAIGRILFLTCFATVCLVQSALAATPAQSGYSDPGGRIQSDVISGHAGTGLLPFTGVDVGMFALAGIGLLIVGLLLRRAATARDLA